MERVELTKVKYTHSGDLDSNNERKDCKKDTMGEYF
jgi:hypothetical protein